MRLLENPEGLRLLPKRGKILRMMPVRHTQQDSSPIETNTPSLQVPGAWDKLIIVIIRCSSKSIISDIYIPAGLQKLDFVRSSKGGERLYRILNPGLMAAERHILVHDFQHPGPDRINVRLSDLRPISLVHTAIVSL